MTCTDRTFMPLDQHEPRGRLAAYLRRQYGHGPATKLLAVDVGCTPTTAENILAGHWPNSRHMAAIVRRFGHDVLAAMFEPEIDEVAARLQAEVRHLEEQLEHKRALARQVARPVAGPSSRLARGENQTTGLKRRASDFDRLEAR